MNTLATMAAATCAAITAACAPLDGRSAEAYATPNAGPLIEDAGPAPTAEQARMAVTAWLQGNLKDPDSLKQFDMLDGPTLVTWNYGPPFGGHQQAWLVCFQYNAKNSYGAYTGVTPDGIALRFFHGQFHAYRVAWARADKSC